MNRKWTACAALLSVLLAPPGVDVSRAGPRGEQTVHGDVTFSRDGSITVIHASDGSIIHYDSFDILSGETVQFIQPGEAARVLNRVLGFDPTHIDGSLLANGIVYIVNPAGVFFGGDALVDVGALVAAAGGISDRDFIEGVDRFSELAGAVENRGDIRADSVVLLGRTVANHGSIVAQDGVIALVAGEEVVLADLSGHVVVHVDRLRAPQMGGVTQAGLLDAGQGQVTLTTGDLYSLAINHTGITRGAEILVDGGDGLVQVAGRLDASNDEGGMHGGRIDVLGDKIAVSAEIDASGAAGGGEIRIGGDFGGEGELRTARRTWVGPESTLRADATDRGDGGRVSIWADESAGFYGEISARGGDRGGDGGFVEISSGQALESRGYVDLRAPSGETGTLLFDPKDILIVGGMADGLDDPDTNDDRLEGDTGTLGEILFGDVGDGTEPFEIFESEIEGSDANIVLEAENSITVFGTFDNDADGPAGTDDPGLNVVLIGNGNSLTMRTRNEAGDEIGATGASGIDLTGGGALDALEFKTLGGDVTIRTGDDGAGGGGGGAAAPIRVGHVSTAGGTVLINTADGGIRVDSIDSSGAAAEDGAGNISVRARGAADVTIEGTLMAVGADGLGADEVGGRGGDVIVTAEDGDLSVGPITADGGNGDAGGGRGGDVAVGFASAGQVGDIAFSGPVSSRGGDVMTEGNGGRGGNVTVLTQQGAIALPAIDASGGDGMDGGVPMPMDRGGNGGTIDVTARGDVDEGEPPGSITIGGVLVSRGGSGTTEGSGGTIGLAASEALEVENGLAGPHVVTGGNVELGGRTIGASDAIQIDGGGTADSKLTLLVEGDADVEIVDAGFDDFDLLQLDASGNIDITQTHPDLMDPATTEVIDIDGAADTSTVRSIDLATGEGGVTYRLLAEDADLVIESGAVVLGGAGRFESQRDLRLEGGSEAAVTTGDQPLTFRADADATGEGDVEVTAGAAPHVVGMGNMDFSGFGVGANETIRIEGGGVADSRLNVIARGDVNLEIETAGFNLMDLRQSDGSADLFVRQAGGDLIQIDGEPAAAPDAPAVSTVVALDTTGNDVGFAFTLQQPDPDGVDPTLVVPTDIVEFGGSGSLFTHGDLTLGTTEGVGIRMSSSNSILGLQADTDRDGSGALRDGVAGTAAAQIDLMGAALVLFGGQGVGEEGNPIQTSGIGSVGAEVDVDGGIHLLNVDSGDMLVTLVGVPIGVGQGVAQLPGIRVQGGPGDVSVVNEAGSITIDGAIRTPVTLVGPRDPTEGELLLRAGEGESIVFELKPDVGDNQQVPVPIRTGGHQTYDSPILLGRPETRLLGGGDMIFNGSIESTGSGTDPDLDGVAPSLFVNGAGFFQIGDNTAEDAVGSVEPLREFVLMGEVEDGLPSTPPPEIPTFSINANLIASEGDQLYTGPVTLGGTTRFDSDGAVGFASTLLGADPATGGAIIDTGVGVIFASEINLAPEADGRLEVNLTGDEPGNVTFIATERVDVGSGGIHLNAGGREGIPNVATIFKNGVPESTPDTGFPEEDVKAPSGVGKMIFETTGDFVMGRNEKLSVGDKLTIRADDVVAGDISAMKLIIDSNSYTILGRDPGNVLLSGGGEIGDPGTDIVANRITLESLPVWDGEGTVPTFFTQSGGVKAPGSLEGFELRLIDANGGKTSLDSFFDAFGTPLDLTGTGPRAVGDPATQNVQRGDQIAYMIPPRSSDEEPGTTSSLDAAEVLRFLECTDLRGGRPAGCAEPAPAADRVLASPRAREIAAIWRELTGPGSEAPRGEFRQAFASRGAQLGGGLALRRELETAPRDEAALAYLNRVDALLTELRILNLREPVSDRVEREILDAVVRAIGAPGLDAATLTEAALSNRSGLLL